MDTTKIISIKLQLKNKELELDIETAKELYDELKRLFREPTITLNGISESIRPKIQPPYIWYSEPAFGTVSSTISCSS